MITKEHINKIVEQSESQIQEMIVEQLVSNIYRNNKQIIEDKQREIVVELLESDEIKNLIKQKFIENIHEYDLMDFVDNETITQLFKSAFKSLLK